MGPWRREEEVMELLVDSDPELFIFWSLIWQDGGKGDWILTVFLG